MNDDVKEIIENFSNMDIEELNNLDGLKLMKIGEAMKSQISKYIGTYEKLYDIDKICRQITCNGDRNGLYYNFWDFISNEFTWAYKIWDTTSINVYFKFKDKKFEDKLINEEYDNVDIIQDSFDKLVCITDVELL